MRARSAPLGLVVCIFSLLGCGGGSAEGTLGGTTAAEVIEAPASTAPRYETTPSTGAVVGEARAEADALERGIQRAASEASIEMRGDGRLGLLAAWTAERLGPGGEPPPHDVVEFFARHLGLVEPVPHLIVLGQPDPATLEAGIADSVRQFLARQPYNVYGGAVVPREGLTLAVVTLSSRWLELDAIPRRIPTSRPVRVHGQLVGAHSNPSLAIAAPSGEVTRLPAGPGPGFDVRVPIRGRGVYRVELLAQGPRGDTVIANFPLYAGVEIPESIALRGEDASSSGDARAVQTSLLRLLNESRRQAGLEPLELHEGLGTVARAHSTEMVERDYVGHTSPTTGTAADRVSRAGYTSGLVLENIGRGYGAQEIHRGLLESPGHRANILNPDVTHVGIGVVGEPEGTRTAYVATEVFVRMAREIDIGSAPAQLLAMLDRSRSARGAPPLSMDETLQRAAQDAAQQFFADPSLSQQDVVDRASASLRRFAIAYRRVGGVMAVVTAIDEAGQLEPVLDPEVRLVGIGVAQGNRPDTGPNSIAVVIVLGWPR